MSDTNEPTRLAELLREQMVLASDLERLSGREAEEASNRLREVQAEGFSIMADYFSKVLYPSLKKQFPDKLSRSESADGKQVMAFTELVQDFFITVRNQYRDEKWVFECPRELRNLAACVIRRDILNGIRQRNCHASHHERIGVVQQIASDTRERLAEVALELEPVMTLLDRWDSMGSKMQQRHARIIRLHYILELTMSEVAEDLSATLSTTYRHHQDALNALRDELVDRSLESFG